MIFPEFSIQSITIIVGVRELLVHHYGIFSCLSLCVYGDANSALVIIPHMTVWTHENNKCGDTIRRRDVTLRLISAYSNLACCCILLYSLLICLFNLYPTSLSMDPEKLPVCTAKLYLVLGQ